MKNTRYWKEPEVHFISSQDKRSEKKSTESERVVRLSENRSTQYLIRIMR